MDGNIEILGRAAALARDEGFAEGRKLGAAAERERFKAIVDVCKGDGKLLVVALDLAVEIPGMTAARTVEVARRFAKANSPANRDTLPDSLAQAQLRP
ncbi:hypothetical protein EN914_32005 [Mesorhizobium sp. M7A.F.Ca.CA.001.08.2.1]|uniref:Uncharacterized protein n=2 Tax=Phyllobacteriaceae TaxID=69277 RepID=A0AB38T573_9HYPH|nr:MULTISPECIES: hypothetical protein [Mesorhizobium]RUY65232.1 hypothetical protein EN980_23335 [Mesorhizobium sp. M7A.F.Ca.CA.001.13.1.1]RUZ09556.1 hypothetical protein EN955_04065 [Mesorhizobium sp. M7A.F.Ca.CA.001.04.2.1]RUZ23461.1 hypothetical protein EN961_08685 [Mesorhizobium sp. M7A.F.Ca.CA.001.09.1.1]RVA71179.1 hypothetical protein EN914_32005 [Mesorhizobium sp. M7A.F.Ca.CA.001.08.2.1]RVA64583.1 hypothetical protein EN913_21505 [Mesorhizobium sp. M7A.F.Ca.CA.001.08.1.1]